MMSDEKVTPLKRTDKYDAIMKAEDQFGDGLDAAIKAAVLAGLPHSMLVGKMYSKLNDVEAGIAVIVDGDEPA